MTGEASPSVAVSEAIIRLADEGIPVCAISRSLRVPTTDVRDLIRQALQDGIIVDHPKDDWPPGSRRTARTPDIEGFFGNDEGLYRACIKYFGVTRQQAIVFGLLLRRPEVTKENLHQAIERDRQPGRDQTSQKLVDVLICNLRRKLEAFNYEIKTLWGHGYLIEPKDRSRAIAELYAYVNNSRDLGNVAIVELNDTAGLKEAA